MAQLIESKIKLGYEIGTGKLIEISPSHLIVTGLSQKAGKTTTLESLIKRSGKKAIVFRTKIGEKSFLEGTVIPPFFREKSDWRYIESLLEATMREKMGKMDRAKIIQLSKKCSDDSLLGFKKVVDQRLEEKISSFETDVLTNLQAYLEIVIPKLQTVKFSKTLELVPGLNIIDLERFSRDGEVQSLIIASVLEEVLNHHKDIIVLIPEAWKFIPQGRGNPCKYAVEEFIRQGATNNNFIWIDSQDMSGVDKIPLKQISEWILGYQAEKNEVKHTLDQIPLPKQSKPKEEDIMTLGTGVFYFASRDLNAKVYVQPWWLDDEKSLQIAKGELQVSEIDAPQKISINKIAIQNVNPDSGASNEEIKQLKSLINKELIDIRTDFFNKIGDLQDQINKVFEDIAEIKTSAPVIDEDVIISKILQKVSVPTATPGAAPNIDQIVSQVLSKIPKSVGNITYEVAPLEKIKKDFIEECRQKILSDIESVSTESKKILKYTESQGRNVTINELVTKCFLKKSGPTNRTVGNQANELVTIEVMRKDKASRFYPELKNRIKSLLGNHGATDDESENLYQHIIMELLLE